jgi:pilus assembly protein CpaF
MSEVRMYLTPRERVAAPSEVRVSSALSHQARHALKTDVHQELIKRMDLEKLAAMQADLEQGRQRLLNIILQLVGEQQIPMSAPDRDQVAEEVLDEVFGLGPLEPLLKDPTVSDILVNTFNTVYVERKGVIEKTNVSFRDNAHLMHIIDKIVSATSRPRWSMPGCSTGRGSISSSRRSRSMGRWSRFAVSRRSR